MADGKGNDVVLAVSHEEMWPIYVFRRATDEREDQRITVDERTFQTWAAVFALFKHAQWEMIKRIVEHGSSYYDGPLCEWDGFLDIEDCTVDTDDQERTTLTGTAGEYDVTVTVQRKKREHG